MDASDRPAVLPAGALVAAAILSAAPVLRAGDVQLLEVVEALAACSAAIWFARAKFRARVPAPWREYGGPYGAVLLLTAIGSALAMRLEFFPPAEISLLKQPLALSLSRLAELALAVYAMLAAASAMRRAPALLRIALGLYVGIAAATAALSILSWILLEAAEISTPLVYGFDDRVRGLFNEGGPYGMFLVSAGVAELLRGRLFRPVYRFRAKALLTLFGGALLLSGSKAGLLACALLAGIAAFSISGMRRRVALGGAAVAAVLIAAVVFESQFLAYLLLYQNVEEAAAFHPDDPNFVMGRITGVFIVPRMIAAHPIAGVGLGNYSLMRNDPEYLGGLPPVEEWDLPGMGWLGATAELGLPLAVFLFAVLARPWRRAAKRSGGAALIAAAAFQPVAFLLGVNLNFFYPWLVTAFVMASEPLV